MSGEEEELSMDELSEITEYIQEKAGDNAEVIFGQGIDPDLGKAIRVTVIATGFEMDRLSGIPRKAKTAPMAFPPAIPFMVSPASEQEVVKTLINLESGKSQKVTEDSIANGATFVFSLPKTPTENPTSQEIPLAEKPKTESFSFEIKPIEESKAPVEPRAEPSERIVHNLFEEEGDKKVAKLPKESEPAAPAFANDYYEQMKLKAIQRAHERFEKLKGGRSVNPTHEELKEKMEVPAYQRKQVVLQEPQHSSEPTISKYNLSDENEILGNNRFLHDNVD